MNVSETVLPGVLLITPTVYQDSRGFFLETFQNERYAGIGLPENFVQDNCSQSKKNVLRGLHYQKKQPQGKLVWVTRGSVFDVAVDIRQDSPHFGKWCGVVLDDIQHQQLYIPPGFAHGFYVLSDIADFCYKCTCYYDAASDAGIRWDDPDIAIEWPVTAPILSEKDANLPLLAT